MADLETQRYRRKLAEDIKAAPKEERSDILHAAKQSSEYMKARESTIQTRNVLVSKKSELVDLEEHRRQLFSELAIFDHSKHALGSPEKRSERRDEMRASAEVFEGLVEICDKIKHSDDPKAEVSAMVGILLQRDDTWIDSEGGNDLRLFFFREYFRRERLNAQEHGVGCTWMSPRESILALKEMRNNDSFLESVVADTAGMHTVFARLEEQTKADVQLAEERATEDEAQEQRTASKLTEIIGTNTEQIKDARKNVERLYSQLGVTPRGEISNEILTENLRVLKENLVAQGSSEDIRTRLADIERRVVSNSRDKAKGILRVIDDPEVEHFMLRQETGVTEHYYKLLSVTYFQIAQQVLIDGSAQMERYAVFELETALRRARSGKAEADWVAYIQGTISYLRGDVISQEIIDTAGVENARILSRLNAGLAQRGRPSYKDDYSAET